MLFQSLRPPRSRLFVIQPSLCDRGEFYCLHERIVYDNIDSKGAWLLASLTQNELRQFKQYFYTWLMTELVAHLVVMVVMNVVVVVMNVVVVVLLVDVVVVAGVVVNVVV